MRSDAELQRDVLNELQTDPRLRIADLDVRVQGKAVTLTGAVETPAQHWRALEIARYVAGIAPVCDRIVVRPR
jgi:osmotically-inducible protein OsmY